MPPLDDRRRRGAGADGRATSRKESRKLRDWPSARSPISTRWMRRPSSAARLAEPAADVACMKDAARGVPRAPAAQRERVAAHRARLRERSRRSSSTFVAARAGRAPRRADGRPTSITGTIRGFLGDLHKPRQHARRRRRASSRRSATFGRYLRREGVIDGDPAALVGTPKREQRLPAHLGEAEMSRCSRCPTRRSRSAAATARSSSCSTRRACA